VPIEHNIDKHEITRDEYHARDYEVMEKAFTVHRDLGRLYDENIYRKELAHRCRESGLCVGEEERVKVSYRTFTKVYYLDMVVDGAIVYELKTIEALSPRHFGQLLNYLMLTGLQHGKLVNFRPSSVQSKFVTTGLDEAGRRTYRIDDTSWRNISAESTKLRDLMKALIAEWGAFLDVSLFREAVTFFWGGEEKVLRKVNVVTEGRVIGGHKIFCLNPDVAFEISAVSGNTGLYENHLHRFLKHTPLEHLQWVNFSHHDILFKTITTT